jgi:DNA-binding HxlR family transcriptional regulator
MATRTYRQMCPVARALDVVGERWTLLVVRELLLGPKRFKELMASLPAMGTNRLSDRLKTLTAQGMSPCTS